MAGARPGYLNFTATPAENAESCVSGDPRPGTPLPSDRDEQIAQKKAIVSIYSDGTAESVNGARLMCANSGNEFTE